MEWQPVSTAPKDGTQVIVPSQWSGMDTDIASYDTNLNHWWSVKIECPIDDPDYWMPIPPLPTPPNS